MTAPPDFSGYRAPLSEHPYRAHPFEPPKQQGPCLSCHREGHLAQNCPTWKGRCYRCHEAGHTSESCSLPDKRGRATRIIATDNRELARALATITRELQEIKAKLRPNWAWRTLRPFRERTAAREPRKPPEGPKPPDPPQPKPPEQQRNDLQGCDPPPHMHIGENDITISSAPFVPAWCIPNPDARQLMRERNKQLMRLRRDADADDPSPTLVQQQCDKAAKENAALNPAAAEWEPNRHREPWPLVACAVTSDDNWHQVDADNPAKPGTKIHYLPQLMNPNPQCKKCGEHGHRSFECPKDAHIQGEKDNRKATPPKKLAPWELALENLRKIPPKSGNDHKASHQLPTTTPNKPQFSCTPPRKLAPWELALVNLRKTPPKSGNDCKASHQLPTKTPNKPPPKQHQQPTPTKRH